MNKRHLKNILLIACLGLVPALVGCSGSKTSGSDSASNVIGNDSDSSAINVDSASIAKSDVPVPGDSAYKFSGTKEIIDYLKSRPDAAKYEGGIIYTMAEQVPDYASQLIAQLSKYSRFIIVDKASMHVILYDKYGQVEKSYRMACARNYGTKHKKADSRTPEGFFSLEGKYDSTDWLFTNDNGYTSPARGQFGPRFLRIKTPVSMQIGIHGTASPGSIGRRASHGCIRITNENIMELYGLAEKGMPVIVLPGKRDREVNSKEGYDVAYFPTGFEDVHYVAEAATKTNNSHKELTKENKKAESDSISVKKPSVDSESSDNKDEKNHPKEKRDSI